MCVKLAYLAFLAIFVVVLGTTTVTLIPVAACVVAEKVQQNKSVRDNNKKQIKPNDAA